MKRTKILILLIILAFTTSIILFNGCVKKGENAIKIGVVAPLTGEGATYGLAMKRGVDLAIDEVNKAGGILNSKITAIYEDDKLNSKEGINAINKLIKFDKVQVIIGSAASRVTLAIAPFAEKSKVVLMSSISTADTIKYSGDYIFRNVPPNLQQGITAAKFAFKVLMKKTAVIFYKNDDYGISLANSFIDEYKNLGGKILFVDNYSPNLKNYRNQLQKIKSKNPEVVFFPGNYEESGIILKQAREINLNASFIGGDGSYSPELLKLAGKSAENTYYTLMALPQDTSKFYVEFKKKYLIKYKEEPDVYSVYSYDVAKILFEAITKVGNYDGEMIKNELYKINYYGVTGNIKFDEYGEVHKAYSIYIVKNGQFSLYMN
ncbi:MAG: ABC transporter substrate-binding protein [bacterium]